MSPPGRSRRLLLAVPAVAFAVLIFVLSSLPGVDVPSVVVPLSDKWLHAAEYAAFGLLLLLAAWGLGSWRWTVAFVAGAAYAAFDEFHQSFVPGRVADLMDWGADVLGLLVAIAVVAVAAYAWGAAKRA